MSESGCPGFKDFQDVVVDLKLGILSFFLSESGCPGLEDFQDVVVLLSMRNRDFGIIDKINYLLNY
ncbi:hypothetical protein OA07_06645 [Aphanizomenon flos-aquae 2012/KM1/D3]|nr:hypothetical protein OA07_06645 [Aphanizomenon flos-aquae 2012/KM1/D3]